jgi:uncharacterized protein
MSELQLDVSHMREARARVDRTYAASAVVSDNEVYSLVAPIALGLDVHRDRDQFRLVGRVTTTLELTCSRCLETFQTPADESFDVLFLPHREDADDADRKIEDDDLTTTFYRDHVIDLGQLMQEQFYLAVPMKPLCREACRGLCANCGTNLNTGPCGCTTTWRDPQLEVLRTLLKKD